MNNQFYPFAVPVTSQRSGTAPNMASGPLLPTYPEDQSMGYYSNRMQESVRAELQRMQMLYLMQHMPPPTQRKQNLTTVINEDGDHVTMKRYYLQPSSAMEDDLEDSIGPSYRLHHAKWGYSHRNHPKGIDPSHNPFALKEMRRQQNLPLKTLRAIVEKPKKSYRDMEIRTKVKSPQGDEPDQWLERLRENTTKSANYTEVIENTARVHFKPSVERVEYDVQESVNSLEDENSADEQHDSDESLQVNHNETYDDEIEDDDEGPSSGLGGYDQNRPFGQKLEGKRRIQFPSQKLAHNVISRDENNDAARIKQALLADINARRTLSAPESGKETQTVSSSDSYEKIISGPASDNLHLPDIGVKISPGYIPYTIDTYREIRSQASNLKLSHSLGPARESPQWIGAHIKKEREMQYAEKVRSMLYQPKYYH